MASLRLIVKCLVCDQIAVASYEGKRWECPKCSRWVEFLTLAYEAAIAEGPITIGDFLIRKRKEAPKSVVSSVARYFNLMDLKALRNLPFAGGPRDIPEDSIQ